MNNLSESSAVCDGKQLRRDQILCAAAECFRTRGFHAASMAEIAKAGGLSVGQIYRYYENKEAVIAGIVDRNLQDGAATLRRLLETDDPAQILEGFINGAIENVACLSKAALMLEITAEATRNPRVADILRRKDEAGRAMVRQALSRLPNAWSPQALEARVEMVCLLVGGVALRMAANPDFDIDAYGATLRSTLRGLLADGA